MLTREQIEEIRAESQERGVSIKRLLHEKGIPEHQYFWWRRKYSRTEVPECFLPVAGGVPPAVMATSAWPGSSRGKSKADPAAENWMSIELRTVSGTDMRIQGGLTPVMVYTILKSL